MQKNFAIAKISEGRGEKEVSGLFVRGECGVGAGENARGAPPANFLGEEREGGRKVAWRPPPRPRLRFSQICGLLRQQ